MSDFNLRSRLAYALLKFIDERHLRHFMLKLTFIYCTLDINESNLTTRLLSLKQLVFEIVFVDKISVS